ncbi:hypothetical protein FACS1894105_05370 [Clostridia bacterium]|nr:hypothetical protein FACS1894105_05370 [Clostridia bacterium]
MKKQENTAITAQNSGFTALANTDISAMMSEELDGLDLSFEKIKIPSGGSSAFEIADENGNPTPVTEFSGVILYQHGVSMYYKTKYTGGSNPPDCGSFDGKIGTGIPGGDCKICSLNTFGSGENGAKACKNRRRIYILREGEMFPVLFSLPSGSLKKYTEYLQKHLSRGMKPCQYVTKFSLQKAVNNGGIAYSQASFVKDRDLTSEEQAIIAPFAAQIKEFAAHVKFDDNVIAEDYIDTETGEVIKPLNGVQNV